MKKQNKTNNVENKIRSILHGVGHFPCSIDSQGKVLHHRGAISANQRGITLIALIITIIIMLILAGVVLTLTIGENGLFSTAKYAAKKWNNSVEQENADLDELYAYINGESLPENTKDTNAGTLVSVPDKWKTNTPAYVRTSDGKEVVSSKMISTVQAVATGDGETVPVPLGFYYVGGKISTGVVISDDVRDQNKYANYTNTEKVKEGIPTGVKYNEDGTVKTYTDEEYKNLSSDEKKSVLMGNQFVWIPVSASEYKKVNWGDSYKNAIWDTETNTAELQQIQKYGGFYIGRYEAGTSDITLSTGIDFAGQNGASSRYNDNFSIREGLNHTVNGKITTKAGEIPYYHADYFTSLKLSNDMYRTNYVQSGLVTGTMWDTMTKFIAKNDNSNITWNSLSEKITYIEGQGRYATFNKSTNYQTSKFSKSDGTSHYGITTTAISEDAKKKNLYDIAGNLSEWTQEAAYSSSQCYMLRGGGFPYSQGLCFRDSGDAKKTYEYRGFRPVLYMK